MHQAVELLLKRMDSNPDEFMSSHRRQIRWDKIIRNYDSFLTTEERDAIKQKYSEIQMEAMHKDIMAELLYGEEQQELKFSTAGQERFRVGADASISMSTLANPSGTLTITGASSPFTSSNLQLGRESLDEATLTKLKALVK